MALFFENEPLPDTYTSIGDIESINVDVVCEIEKELEPCSVYSLVFLLYDVAHTALQRLIIYQRISSDNSKTNLLSEWVLGVQIKIPGWRHKLIEALAICQLFRIIRKLGLKVSKVKKHFKPEDWNQSIYINPAKKLLYILCENITSKQLPELKRAAGTYDINVSEYEICELIFLKMLCNNFITINCSGKQSVFNLDKLANIMERFSELRIFATDLRKLGKEDGKNNADSSPQIIQETVDKKPKPSLPKINNKIFPHDLEDTFSLLNKLSDELPISDNMIKIKSLLGPSEVYPLKNKSHPGVCYIINQEIFTNPELNRIGSSKDSLALKNTMKELNFDVITHSDLKQKVMMENIKDVIKYRVSHDHSMFMLCILSHGIKDHVFAADAVPIRVDDIQSMFDMDYACHLYDIPKILIIEACQIEDEQATKLIADSPKQYHIRKSDCLIYYATASQLEAYRHPEHGTIFIQILCQMLKKYADKEEVLSIFTRVNNMVRQLCEKIKKEQTPTISTTLVKKLYLK